MAEEGMAEEGMAEKGMAEDVASMAASRFHINTSL